MIQTWMTIKQALKFCLLQLRAKVSHPVLESEIILAYVLNKPLTYLYTSDHNFTPNEVKAIRSLIEQRLSGRPIAYLTGHKEFFGLEFLVSPAVLIPRPESELLVELALNHTKNYSNQKVLEIGSGSGCLSISLTKCSTSLLATTCIDISSKAILIAMENSRNILGKESKRINFIKMDVFKYNSTEMFDLIISNPPYIPTQEIISLAKDVRDYEPIKALDGGKDGLKFYRQIKEIMQTNLKSPGKALLEVHAYQSRQTQKLFEGYKTHIYQDISGKDRVLEISV